MSTNQFSGGSIFKLVAICGGLHNICSDFDGRVSMKRIREYDSLGTPNSG